MSEARSLTPLSETDYEAIEAAVMETARGRWFMAEFARRNRQADTLQLLGAIGRIERVVGIGQPEQAADAGISEAAALIADLRIDLERISGRADERASGLAARIATAASRIVQATESMQEAAWSLREAGANEALCDMLDQRAAEISAATMIVDGTVQQIDKIADTIAMLDSSLRAVSGLSADSRASAEAFPAAAYQAMDLEPRKAASLNRYDDVDIIDIESHVAANAMSHSAMADVLGDITPRIGSIYPLDDDIVFQDPTDEAAADAMEQPSQVAAFQQRIADELPAVSASPALGSEAGLRELEALSADKKLVYFA